MLDTLKGRMVQIKLSSNKPLDIQHDLDELRERTRALVEGLDAVGAIEKKSVLSMPNELSTS